MIPISPLATSLAMPFATFPYQCDTGGVEDKGKAQSTHRLSLRRCIDFQLGDRLKAVSAKGDAKRKVVVKMPRFLFNDAGAVLCSLRNGVPSRHVYRLPPTRLVVKVATWANVNVDLESQGRRGRERPITAEGRWMQPRQGDP
jgi:hypothetical protein